MSALMQELMAYDLSRPQNARDASKLKQVFSCRSTLDKEGQIVLTKRHTDSDRQRRWVPEWRQKGAVYVRFSTWLGLNEQDP